MKASPVAEFYWSKACPGLYYLWDGPKESNRSPIAKVEHRGTGFYTIAVFGTERPQPPVQRAPWSPRTAMEAMERHIRTSPQDTFTREYF